MKWTTIKNNTFGMFCIVAICMLFVACGPSTTKPPTTVPPRYEQVDQSICLNLFRENKIGIYPGVLTKDFEVAGIPVGDFITAANYVMPDGQYMIVDEEWFKREILNKMQFESFLFKNGIEGYNKLRNDCDDFSRAFTFFVRIKFRTMGFMKATPAIGDLHYSTPYDNSETEFGGGHAINIGIFLDKNGKRVIRFIEPQGPNFVELDEETKQYYIRFMGM